LILLPRVIDDINENKALNYHLYQALRKALYKPAAFYKGVLLPLCEVSCVHRAFRDVSRLTFSFVLDCVITRIDAALSDKLPSWEAFW